MPSLKKSFNEPHLYQPSLEVDFDPDLWLNSNIIETTGSYAYAVNLPQLGEVKLGSVFAPAMMDTMITTSEKDMIKTEEDLAKMLERDGMFYLGKSLPESGHVIAIFDRERANNSPYEMLKPRRDSNGRWSYRVQAGCPSPSEPTQKDWSGKLITDIEKANLGPYTKLLGYAAMPYTGIMYYPRLDLTDERMAPFSTSVPAVQTLGLSPNP